MDTTTSSLCNDSLAEMSMLPVKNVSSMAALSEQCVQDFFIRSFYDFLQMFYIVWPSENSDDPEVNYELNVSYVCFIKTLKNKPLFSSFQWPASSWSSSR